MGSMISLTMTLSWIYSVCVIIQKIVYEKEKRLKEVSFKLHTLQAHGSHPANF